MTLGTVVGLDPGHIVLDGNPATLPERGAEPPQKSARSYLHATWVLWPNGWLHQDATWYGGRPRPRRLCVRWDPARPRKSAHPPHPMLAHVSSMWPNGWTDQDAYWFAGKPWPSRRCHRWSRSPKKGTTLSFRFMFVAKQLDG